MAAAAKKEWATVRINVKDAEAASAAGAISGSFSEQSVRWREEGRKI